MMCSKIVGIGLVTAVALLWFAPLGAAEENKCGVDHLGDCVKLASEVCNEVTDHLYCHSDIPSVNEILGNNI